MNDTKTVTCSFTLDRDIYDAYKSIVVKNHENVKGNLIRYMRSVIQFETPNPETIEAIREVEMMKNNPGNYKTYNSFDEILAELDEDE